jgi:hypothetical protein
MIDYFYSIKITNSESVGELDEFNKLKDATYDMSSIIKHEIPVKTYKEIRKIRIIKKFIVKQSDSSLFFLFDFIAAIIAAIFAFVFGIYFLITSYQDYSEFAILVSIFGAALLSFLIFVAHHRFKSIAKSIAWDKKVAVDRGITTEEVKKCYTIVKESAWVKFNKMIFKKANDEIQKVKQLFDDGVISQEDFDKKKKDLLG